MRTLYLRNVPDDVVSNLEELAAAAGMSVSAYATRELGQVSAHLENLRLLRTLPRVEVGTQDILQALDEARGR